MTYEQLYNNQDRTLGALCSGIKTNPFNFFILLGIKIFQKLPLLTKIKIKKDNNKAKWHDKEDKAVLK